MGKRERAFNYTGRQKASIRENTIDISRKNIDGTYYVVWYDEDLDVRIKRVKWRPSKDRTLVEAREDLKSIRQTRKRERERNVAVVSIEARNSDKGTVSYGEIRVVFDGELPSDMNADVVQDIAKDSFSSSQWSDWKRFRDWMTGKAREEPDPRNTYVLNYNEGTETVGVNTATRKNVVQLLIAYGGSSRTAQDSRDVTKPVSEGYL